MSVSVVLVGFFSRVFFGLAFCGFLPKLRFSVAAQSDGILQRFVRRFALGLRQKMIEKVFRVGFLLPRGCYVLCRFLAPLSKEQLNFATTLLRK